ncbi:MAG: ATP-dependent zinc protease, partial [Wenzhouxiangella sp.]
RHLHRKPRSSLELRNFFGFDSVSSRSLLRGGSECLCYTQGSLQLYERCPLLSRPAFVLGAVLMLFVGSASADTIESTEYEIFGWVEWVKLLDGELRLKAKLDTGAANSSLDATNISRFRKDGERWVRFTVTDPDNGTSLDLEKPLVRNVRIVRHGGEHQRRPVIEMPICLGHQTRLVEVNLIDRSNFIYPMLLGRSALEGFALIDSGQTFQHSPDCSNN